MAVMTADRRRTSRAAHRDPLLLALVFLGGSAGTALRALLEDAFAPGASSWPWPTFLINLTGAFALGALLEGLTLVGEDAGARRSVRLGVGTGLLGGFTTYSTFMVETARLPVGLGLCYLVASVVLGALGAFVGIRGARAVLASRRGRA